MFGHVEADEGDDELYAMPVPNTPVAVGKLIPTDDNV